MKLGDAIELKYGKGLTQKSRKPGNVGVYGSNGLVDYHNVALINGPGIIVGRKGSVGAVTWAKNDFWPIDTTYYVQLKSEGSLRYWYYYLKTLRLERMNSHAAVPGLNRDTAYSVEISELSPNKQRSIASILSSYDDLIENNSKRIKKLESMVRFLYRHYFEVPESDDWDIVKVGEILGKVPKSSKLQKSDYLEDGTYPVIDQSKKFIAGYTNKLDTVIVEKLPLTIFGDHTRAVKLAQEPFARGADGTQIITSDALPPYYLYHTIKELPLSNEHYARHFKILKVTEIKAPPENILDEFEAKVEPIYKLINVLMKRNRGLSKARDLLLPRLMSGEIEV